MLIGSRRVAVVEGYPGEFRHHSQRFCLFELERVQPVSAVKITVPTTMSPAIRMV